MDLYTCKKKRIQKKRMGKLKEKKLKVRGGNCILSRIEVYPDKIHEIHD